MTIITMTEYCDTFANKFKERGWSVCYEYNNKETNIEYKKIEQCREERYGEIIEDFENYAKEVTKKIKDAGISSIVDLKKHNLNYKIREHSLAKIPILLICGKKEVDSKSVTIRRLDSNKQENMKLDLFLKSFSALNKVS